MNIEATALLQLLQLTSPSLPIGGFAWSQGLESAIERQWLNDEVDLETWLQGILAHGFVWQEWPLLQRLYQAAADENWQQLQHWNQVALALRETAELRQEDTQMGAALIRLLRDLGSSVESAWHPAHNSYVSAFAVAALMRAIPLESAGLGLAWGWLENQIAAALKTFPMGQTAGQRVFHRLVDQIPGYYQKSLQVTDDEIGFSLPGQVLASMLHEHQYSRLFRS